MKDSKLLQAASERIQYVIYVGTNKITFVKARICPGKVPEIASLSSRLALGFERGTVKDLVQATELLNQTVQDIVGDHVEAVLPCRVVISNPYF